MTEPAPGEFDLWRNSAGAEPEEARDLAALLELRARDPDQIAARAEYLDLLAIEPGDQVLDVGCGSGAVTRDLARRVGRGGRVVGVDPSAALLHIARELLESAESTSAVKFQVGDARELRFPDGAFDVVLTATTLAHVPGAEQVIPELVRVTRPGGRLGVFDLDGDGVLIAHPDRRLTRRIIAAASDHLIVNGWLARQLPALLAGAGLVNVGVRAFTLLERDPGGFAAAMAVRRAAVALEVGAVNRGEHDRWLDSLRAEQAAGRFLAGQTHLFSWGTRP